MADLKDDIERYLRGQLTAAEMHALEKKALNDPFLSEALEGASSLTSEHFFSDVIELRHRMRDKKKRTSPLVISLRIAASIALLAVATYGVYIFTRVDEVIPIAEQKPAAQPPAPDAKGRTDSLLASANEKPTEKPKETLLSLGPVVSTPTPVTEKAKTQPVTKSTQPLEEAEVRKTDVATEDARKLESQDLAALKQDAPVNPISGEVVADQPRKDVTDDKAKVTVGRERAGAGLVSTTPPQVINGKVTDAKSGDAIPGANILIKGTTQGTVSDANGNYQVTTNTADKLVVSMIGFETKEVPVPQGKNQLDVQLPADVSQLSEVVVTGYAAKTSNTAARDEDDAVHLAEPAGGRKSYDGYLAQNLRYPQQALEKKIEGRVTLEFAVQPDGSLSDFSVVRGLEGGCNDEVIRLVKEGPAWKPSSQGGVSVKSTVRVRVRFKLPK